MNVDYLINEVEHNSIKLDDIECSNDFNSIKSILNDKKYVFIGESSHGSMSIFWTQIS